MQIQFSWGATRFVILIGTIAIKIARLRPFRGLQRLLEHWINGEVKERLLTFAENPFLAGIRYIFSGIIANRNERRLWQEFPRRFLIPTLYSFGPLINIQKRGEKISQEELDASHPFQGFLEGMPPKLIADMTRATNFCRYKGRICLVDYGNDEALAFFLLPQPSDATLTLVNMARN
ncbi:MAG: hypothetical protein Q7K26_02435 [bacterium]|nr:hypothetical protein [bacterium]